MSFQETPVFIPVDFMQEFLQESFAQAGCSLEESERVTRRLIGANLRGHESHGVARMPRYVEWVQKGTLIPNQKIRLIQENEVLSILDGGHGFGQSIGEQTIQRGVEKALKQGVSVTALRIQDISAGSAIGRNWRRNPELHHFTWSMCGGACWLRHSGE